MTNFVLYPVEGQRDHFLDFLKGVAILGVIWLHCMPMQNAMLGPLWCGMSVSFFLLIQVFHSYRKGAVSSHWPNVWKLLNRIVCPMLAVTAFLALLQLQFGIVHHADGMIKMLQDGGYGPGSYYPWIYLQFAIMIPMVGRLQKYLSPGLWGGGNFITFDSSRVCILGRGNIGMVMEIIIFQICVADMARI